MRLSKHKSVLALMAAVALAASAVLSSPAQAKPNVNLADKLVKEIHVANVIDHLEALQAAAGDEDRASGTAAYDASLAYIKGKLDGAGYQTTVQQFPFTYSEEIKESFRVVSPFPRDVAIDVMTFSPATPAGGVTGRLVHVGLGDATPGCEAADFVGFPAGSIAHIPRGACTFALKAQNAQAFGAIGVVISNNDTANPELVVNGTLGAPGAVSIPVGGISWLDGQLLFLEFPFGLTVNLDLAEVTEQRTTSNLIAEWPFGNPDNVVMTGAHLDSVPAGPGINDNGTGAAGTLEAALQLAEEGGRKVPNRMRFAWWGAEEFGLVGSTFYVNSLDAAERAKIKLYLNFDMIGSPNYMFGIYDGDDSDGVGAGPGPAGSAQIEKVLERYFDSRNVPHIGTDFSGRSDYQAFIANGIPAGGLFTGAEVAKTQAEQELFGGVAGEAFDPCYHQACDSFTPVADGADAALYAQLDDAYDLVGNVNVHALSHNADAIGYAVGTFAMSLKDLNAP